MEMEATGKSRGEWIFHDDFDRTVGYLSDHAKILGFNPFCYKVERVDLENVFKWHFRVTDPQNNPFDVIFYVEQFDEILVELPPDFQCDNPDELSEEMIRAFTVGKKISWRHHPLTNPVDDPKNYLFEGKAFAEMYVHPVMAGRTRVHFDLKIDVKFVLYPAFRIIPEQIIRAMTNAGMSMIMQTATNKMFQSISKDFGFIEHA
ncbi:MAG: DUF1997 domain-containing protein [Chlorobiaceae bacterium]|jgi:hypothetical protein|nr:DUF1997 domain-containing protein [Chlorobiaceae bacterium]NTW63534.1 DUF1997 domain-containing protein [Chlorobiaceae bacterium]